MKYEQKTENYTVDLLELNSDEYGKLNEIFKRAIEKKYSTPVKTENLQVDKIIVISGLYRVEFNVTEIKDDDVTTTL